MARGRAEGAESAAPLGAVLGAPPSDPTLPGCHACSLHSVSWPTGPPCTRGEAAVPGRRGARAAGALPRPRRTRAAAAPPRGAPDPARTRAGGARCGAGAGLRARPACAAAWALRIHAVWLRPPSLAELSDRARKAGAGAGMERRAPCGAGRGLSGRGRPGTGGCVAARPPSGGHHLCAPQTAELAGRRPGCGQRKLLGWRGRPRGARRGAAGGAAVGGARGRRGRAEWPPALGPSL